MDAAKTAVDNANSARTEAAVQRAIRALSAAVETAETAKTAAQADLDAAQAALTEAQDYRTAQTAILDGLQPITAARLSLAAVKPAATVAEAAAALDAARNAVAAATSTRTAAAIQRARRALSQAVDTADAAFDAARSDLFAASDALTRAQNYRTEQTPILNSLPFTQPPGTPPPPSSPPGEFRVTHMERSFLYRTNLRYGDPVSGYDDRCIINERNRDCFNIIGSYSRDDKDAKGGWYWDTPLRPNIHPSPVESYWPNVRGDVRGLDNGFREIRRVNGITIARKDFDAYNPSRVVDLFENDQLVGKATIDRGRIYDRYIVGIGSYGAFEMLSEIYEHPDRRLPSGVPIPYYGGFASAFGERSVRAPNRVSTTVLYRGAMAGVKHEERGAVFTGTATLTYRISSTGDTINLVLREQNGGWSSNSNMRVNNDGSFSNVDNSIKGDFYGPNWDEAAGIVQTRNVYGGWLVHEWLLNQ